MLEGKGIPALARRTNPYVRATLVSEYTSLNESHRTVTVRHRGRLGGSSRPRCTGQLGTSQLVSRAQVSGGCDQITSGY